jgi:hypothetical protein
MRPLAALCLLVSAFCVLPSAFCSQTGGSGRMVGCVGGLPFPCAPIDRVPRATLGNYGTNTDGTWTDSGPQIGQAFINDFGEREVRATDGNVPGGFYGGDGWSGPVGWWFNYFSVYDSAIAGYYFDVPLDNGAGSELFTLNPATMQVANLCPAAWSACKMPYVGEWSFVTPGLMYYSDAGQICAWNYDTNSGAGNCTDGHGTMVYDFAASCPGLSGQSFYDLVVAGDDKTFSVRNSNILSVYSSRYAKCYWANVSTSQIGGTDNPTPLSATFPNWPSGYGFHDGHINPSGQYGWMAPNNGGTLVLFWQVYGATGTETTTANSCTATSGSCQGHISLGYGNAVYVESNPPSGGVSSHYDFGLTPLGAPTTGTHVFASGPPWYNPYVIPNCNVTDTHTQWENVTANDLAPFVESSFVDGSNAPFLLMQIHCAWDHEIDAVAVDGSGAAWRLAHNRASGQQNPLAGPDTSYNALSMPVCSSDGRYCLFATDWQAALGTQTGEISGSNYCQGAYGCQWHASTAYAHYQEVIDSNGNEEMAAAGGTSGASAPAWPTTIGGTVTDGGVTWQMGAGCNTAQTTTTQGTCRTDVFIVEVK